MKEFCKRNMPVNGAQQLSFAKKEQPEGRVMLGQKCRAVEKPVWSLESRHLRRRCAQSQTFSTTTRTPMRQNTCTLAVPAIPQYQNICQLPVSIGRGMGSVAMMNPGFLDR
ncbi:hypothetical protein TNCV_520131 [Trichonephila clavipes]|nr:hypothetical protein TNCV_520131 [Trichonephila clavipes]